MSDIRDDLENVRKAYMEIYNALGKFLDQEEGESPQFLDGKDVEEAWLAFNHAPGPAYFDRIRTELAERDEQEPIKLLSSVREFLEEGIDDATKCETADMDEPFADNLGILRYCDLYRHPPAPVAVPEGWRLARAETNITIRSENEEKWTGVDEHSESPRERLLWRFFNDMLQSAEPASHSESQNEGLEVFDELMWNVLFLNVHERSKLERIVRKHLCESRDDVKAEALEEWAQEWERVDSGPARFERRGDFSVADLARMEANRLRGEGSE